jgi:hypothetical protein
VKKTLLFGDYVNEGVIFGIVLAIISTHPVSARVLMSGGTHAQNFDSPAGGGTANPRTDNVALPDINRTFSTSSAPRQTFPQPPSVILWSATIGLSHRLPDFPRLATRQQTFRVNPSLKGHTI